MQKEGVLKTLEPMPPRASNLNPTPQQWRDSPCHHLQPTATLLPHVEQEFCSFSPEITITRCGQCLRSLSSRYLSPSFIRSFFILSCEFPTWPSARLSFRSTFWSVSLSTSAHRWWRCSGGRRLISYSLATCISPGSCLFMLSAQVSGFGS